MTGRENISSFYSIEAGKCKFLLSRWEKWKFLLVNWNSEIAISLWSRGLEWAEKSNIYLVGILGQRRDGFLLVHTAGIKKSYWSTRERKVSFHWPGEKGSFFELTGAMGQGER
jgi:hypothetical protein